MSSLLVSTLLGSPDCSFAVGTSPLEVVTHNSMTTVSPLWISGEEMMSPQASKVNKFIRLPSGVEYYDAIVGEGADTVKEGTSVQFQWVLRRYVNDTIQFIAIYYSRTQCATLPHIINSEVIE